MAMRFRWLAGLALAAGLLAAQTKPPVTKAAPKAAAKKATAAAPARATKVASTARPRIPIKATKSARTKGTSAPVAASRPRRPEPPRQAAPTSDRFREIQESLIAKGYLQGPASGVWDQSSAEAMKRFQGDQKLEPTGKITSRALISLGLGPKDESAAPATASSNTTSK